MYRNLAKSVTLAALFVIATGVQAGVQLQGPGIVVQGPGLILQGRTLNGPPLVIQGPSLTGFGLYPAASTGAQGAPAGGDRSAIMDDSAIPAFFYPQTLLEACAAPMPHGGWPLSGLDGRSIRVSLPN